MPSFIDLTGQKFGLLKVVNRSDRTAKSGNVLWNCLCECSNTCTMASYSLRFSKISSCGCAQYVHRGQGSKSPFWKGAGELGLHYFNSVKNHATSKNREFTITIEEAWQIFIAQEGKCALTGKDIIIKSSTVKKWSASLDRIDSSQGYTIDNVQWVHKDINKLKTNFTQEYFIQLCKEVTEYAKA